ncbi:MAG TPA: methyltransferase domain-containing protein [Candidatus Methanoperedens sp.]|nr:methyltransferase domain-containing protein [Candidatus Methanoperedens sp.]
MDTFEIKDDEINVEEIMHQIRENIQKRRQSGTYDTEIESLINQPLQIPLARTEDGDIKSDLDYLNSHWDVHAEYSIISHRPVIGQLLISGRQLIHGEVKRYADLIAGKQTEFNLRVIRSLKNILDIFETKIASVDNRIDTVDNRIASVDNRIDTVDNRMDTVDNRMDTVDNRIDTVDNRIASVDNRIDTVDNRIDTVDNKITEVKGDTERRVTASVNKIISAANNDIKNKAWLSNILEERVKKDLSNFNNNSQNDEIFNYFLFEEKYRGSTEDIKKRQTIFLDYFKNGQNVLDIGCGRGEFLSLLKENGIGAKGVDINEDMVLYCKKNGLDVEKVEALSFLRSIADKSLDGIFSGQVIEHLQPEDLINLVKICHDKLKYGTYFIAETINPLCLSVFAKSFYMDMSHVKPVHPATIKFLLESVGFREVEFRFFSPHTEDSKLGKVMITDNMNGEEKARIEVMNRNIDMLNELLFGYQDYAVVGKK